MNKVKLTLEQARALEVFIGKYETVDEVIEKVVEIKGSNSKFLKEGCEELNELTATTIIKANLMGYEIKPTNIEITQRMVRDVQWYMKEIRSGLYTQDKKEIEEKESSVLTVLAILGLEDKIELETKVGSIRIGADK